MTLYYTTFPVPNRRFSVAVNADGALVAAAFGDITALRQRLTVATPEDGTEWLRNEKRTAEAARQVRAYFGKDRRDFTIELSAIGTAFQRRVWTALRKIPYGETRSYGQLARMLGTAPRAIGRANATNPIVLIVPCHRVIGASGALTGFAFGEDVKRMLLQHEGVAV